LADFLGLDFELSVLREDSLLECLGVERGGSLPVENDLGECFVKNSGDLVSGDSLGDLTTIGDDFGESECLVSGGSIFCFEEAGDLV
jgi:hypothetical protein